MIIFYFALFHIFIYTNKVVQVYLARIEQPRKQQAFTHYRFDIVIKSFKRIHIDHINQMECDHCFGFGFFIHFVRL